MAEEEIIRGARRVYPGGRTQTAQVEKIDTHGTRHGEPDTTGRATSTRMPSFVIPKNAVVIVVQPVRNGFLVTVGEDTYVAPTTTQMADIIENAVVSQLPDENGTNLLKYSNVVEVELEETVESEGKDAGTTEPRRYRGKRAKG